MAVPWLFAAPVQCACKVFPEATLALVVPSLSSSRSQALPSGLCIIELYQLSHGGKKSQLDDLCWKGNGRYLLQHFHICF